MVKLRLAAVFPHVELLLFVFFLLNHFPPQFPTKNFACPGTRKFHLLPLLKFDWSLRGLFRMGRKLPVETKHAQVQSKGLTQEAQNYPENKKFFSTFGYKIVQFQTQMGV